MVGLTVAGGRSLVAVVPHGDAAVVAGRVAVLPADRVAVGGRLSGFGSWRRQWRRRQHGGGRRQRRGGRRHRSHNWFSGDVVGPAGLFLRHS